MLTNGVDILEVMGHLVMSCTFLGWANFEIRADFKVFYTASYKKGLFVCPYHLGRLKV